MSNTDHSAQLRETIEQARSEIETLVSGGFTKKDAESQAHWTARRLRALPRDYDSTELWLQLLPGLVHPKKLVRQTALAVLTKALRPALGIELKVETGPEDEQSLQALVQRLAQEHRRLDLYLTGFAPHCTLIVGPDGPTEEGEIRVASVAEAEPFLRDLVSERMPLFPDLGVLAGDLLARSAEAKKADEAVAALGFLYHLADEDTRRSLLEGATRLLAEAVLQKRKLGLDLLLTWYPTDLAARVAPLASDKNKKIRDKVASILAAESMELPEELVEPMEAWLQQDKVSGSMALRAIHRACLAGSKPAVEYLLNRGYDLEEPTATGERPLHYAVSSGSTELVRFLLEQGVAPDARDHRGRSPLSYLTQNATLELVRILLENGADVNAEDEFGWSVLAHALAEARPEVARYLAEQGAGLGRAGHRDLLRTVPPDLFELTIEKVQVQAPDAVAAALWDDLSKGDGKRALQLFVALGEGRESKHLQSVLQHADLEVLQAFDEAGFIDWGATLPTEHGTFPVVALAYRNTKPEVRDYVLDRAPRLEPVTEFQFEKDEHGRWQMRHGAGSLAATVIATDGGMEHLERVLGHIEPATNRTAAAAVRKWGDAPHYLLHLFEHHAEDLDPLAPADGAHTPLLRVILDTCTGKGRDRLEAALMAHPAVRAHAERNGLPRDIEAVASHVESMLHGQRREALSAELAQRGEEAVFSFLESGDQDKVQAALDAARRDEDLGSRVLKRYRPLIEARLDGPTSDLESLREALPAKAHIEDLFGRLGVDADGELFLDLSMASDDTTRRIVDILGFLAARHLDLDAYEEAASRSKSAEELLSLAAEWASRLDAGLRRDAETAPGGWLARLAARLRAPSTRILLDHTHMTSWTGSPLAQAFLFLLGRGPCRFDMNQSFFGDPPAFVWLLPIVPVFEDSDGHLELPPSPLPFDR